jgi:curved DNA-binding protein CbpA
MAMAETHYSILGVRTDASGVQIEEAYREQVRKYHPDLNPNDERARQRFQEIQSAFDVLHAPERREMYDLSLSPAAFERTGPSEGDAVTVDLFEQGDLDSLRFLRRTPGTALVPYRRRSRLMSLVEWLRDSDFLLPLVLVLPFVVIQVVWIIAQIVGALLG